MAASAPSVSALARRSTSPVVFATVEEPTRLSSPAAQTAGEEDREAVEGALVSP